MKKISILSFLLLFVAFHVQAQSTVTSTVGKVPGRTSFFAELGGPGILFSANMDTRFKPTHLGLGGRAGVGFVTATEDVYNSQGQYISYNEVSAVTIPVQLNYIFGKVTSPHTFEVGGGITYVGRELDIMSFYNDRSTKLFGTFAFMYRRQPVDGGFTWRIGFTPMVGKGYIQPFGAASVGYSF